MAVPQYERRVATRALPNGTLGVRADARDFGAAIGEGVRDVGRTLSQIAAEEKAKADQIAEIDADNKAAAAETKLMSPALATRGKNAFGLPDSVLPAFDEATDTIGKELTAEQRQRFMLRQAARRNGIDRALNNHMSREAEEYDKAEFQGIVANSRDAIGLYYNDPDRVGQEIGRQGAEVDAYAARNGKPPEWITETKTQVVSQSHATVIGQYLAADNDIAAKDWFDRNDKAITPEHKETIARSLEIAGTRGASLREADRIFDPAKPLETMLDEVRKISDPKIQDATMARVIGLRGSYDRAVDERFDRAFQAGYDVVADPKNLRGMDAVPPGVIAGMRTQDREKLAAYAAKRAAGQEPATDWAVYYDLQGQASAEATRDGFLQTNLLKHRMALGDAEFKELARLQSDLRASRTDKAAQGKAVATILSRDEPVDQALRTLYGKPPGQWSEAEVQASYAFKRQVDRAVNAAGKNDPQTVQAIVDKLMIDDTWTERGTPGIFGRVRLFGSYDKTVTGRAFQRPGADRLALTVQQVPRADRDQIEAAFKAKGRQFTDDDVIDLYNSQLGPTDAE